MWCDLKPVVSRAVCLAVQYNRSLCIGRDCLGNLIRSDFVHVPSYTCCGFVIILPKVIGVSAGLSIGNARRVRYVLYMYLYAEQ